MLRLLRRDQGLLEIDALGFLPESLRRFQKSFQKAWGMVLVTGPTGSGKSTTLYATINELNVPSRNTITVEDPIEYRISGIKQTQVNPKAGYTFASGLRAALRADPRYHPHRGDSGSRHGPGRHRGGTDRSLGPVDVHANDAASSTTRLMDTDWVPTSWRGPEVSWPNGWYAASAAGASRLGRQAARSCSNSSRCRWWRRPPRSP